MRAPTAYGEPKVPFHRVLLMAAAFFAAATFAEAASAQVGGATDQSTHIGGSTGTGQTGTDAGSPVAPSGMHAPSGPETSGSTGTGKTSRHGLKVPRGMHAPTGPTMGGSVGTGETGTDIPKNRD